MTLTADDILTEIDPYKIIDKTDVTGSFRRLSKEWHPDRPSGNKDVFAKIGQCRDQVEAIEGGEKEVGHVRMFRSPDAATGKLDTHKLVFYGKFQTDTGCMYFCRRFVVFAENKKLSNLFNSSIPDFSFHDAKMKKGLVQFLPMSGRVLEEDDTIGYIFEKEEDKVSLHLLVSFLGIENIKPVHAAWMTSRMLHVACYLQYAGLVHTGFNMSNLLVSPAMHTVSLLGGWRLAKREGDRFSAVPAFTAKHAPRRVMEKKVAHPSMDLEAIKAIARTLFGDVNGRDFKDKTPKEVQRWLRLPSQDALVEYKLWEKALAGFGPRKFVEMGVDVEKIYQSLRRGDIVMKT